MSELGSRPSSLSPDEVALLATELQSVLLGAKVQRIYGPLPDRILLHLYRQGQRWTLVIIAGPPLPRVHLIAASPPNPERPSELVHKLRRDLEGARIDSIAATPGERTLSLSFTALEEAEPVTRRLEIELFARRPNLVLVSEEGRITALLDPSANRREGLNPGALYTPPPMRPLLRPEVHKAPFAWLRECTAPNELAREAPLSARLEDSLAALEADAKDATEAEKALVELRRRLKKERKLEENLEAELRETGNGEALRARGERVKIALSHHPQNARALTLQDPETGATEQVALPLGTTPAQYMASLFEAAKKADRALPKIAQRLGQVSGRIERLQAFEARLMAFGDEDFAPLRAEAVALELLPKLAARSPKEAAAPRKKQVVQPRKPYRLYRSSDGLEILVGRTSKDNDELTFKIGKGQDLWLHVADYPGSHVIIRCPGEVPANTLLEAALLAAHFSKAPPGAKLDVSWTRRKHVHKFKGANSGQVQLAERKTVRVRPDKERLESLLASEVQGDD